jgi:hypothetical protein
MIDSITSAEALDKVCKMVLVVARLELMRTIWGTRRWQVTFVVIPPVTLEQHLISLFARKRRAGSEG